MQFYRRLETNCRCLLPSSGVNKAVINHKVVKPDASVSFDFSHTCVLVFTFPTRRLIGAISQISRPSVVTSYLFSRHCTGHISNTGQEAASLLRMNVFKSLFKIRDSNGVSYEDVVWDVTLYFL
jgi:hypothetical protein